jgi:hypothetical protein
VFAVAAMGGVRPEMLDPATAHMELIPGGGVIRARIGSNVAYAAFHHEDQVPPVV